MKKEFELLKKLSEVDGISGHEHNVAKLIRNEAEQYVDEVNYDNLGSLIMIKKGEANEPTIMLAAHMDEVGFVVSKIEDRGYLRIHPIGGWWPHVVLAEMMTVETSDGKKYLGVTCAEPPHGMPREKRNTVLDIKDVYIDMGVKDKSEIEKLGIKIGDTVTPKMDFHVLNDGKTLLGKAWDDRIGAAVIIEVLKRLSSLKTKSTVAGVFSTQEEVGLRGAKTSSYQINPDIAFAIDVTMSYDSPTSPKNDTVLGNGVALSILDGSVIAHRGLFDFVEKIAKEHNVKYTYDLLTAGGTDSGEIHKQRSGVITMTLSLPCRYFHSHVSLIDYDDYQQAVELVYQVVKTIDKDVLNQLKMSKYE